MSNDDEPPASVNIRCEVHTDQPVFIHWGRGYCPQCRKWYDIDN